MFLILLLASIFANTYLKNATKCNEKYSAYAYRIEIYNEFNNIINKATGIRVEKGVIYSVLHAVAGRSLRKIKLYNAKYKIRKEVNGIEIFYKAENTVKTYYYTGENLYFLRKKLNADFFYDFVKILFNDDSKLENIDLLKDYKLKENDRVLLIGFGCYSVPTCASYKWDELTNSEGENFSLEDLVNDTKATDIHSIDLNIWELLYPSKRTINSRGASSNIFFSIKKGYSYFSFGDSGGAILLKTDDGLKYLAMENSINIEDTDNLKQHFIAPYILLSRY